MEISVINKRSLSDALPGVTRVYVGRPSPLGNPFKIGRDGDRDAVVGKYRQWLWRNMNNPKVKAELNALLGLALKGSLELVCWCAPQACHADVIANALRWLNSQQP